MPPMHPEERSVVHGPMEEVVEEDESVPGDGEAEDVGEPTSREVNRARVQRPHERRDEDDVEEERPDRFVP